MNLNPKKMTVDQCVDHLNEVAKSWGGKLLSDNVRKEENLPKLRKLVAKMIRQGQICGEFQS